MESHTILVAPKEVVHEHHKQDVEIKSSQKEDVPLSNQDDAKVAKHSVVKVDF